MYPNYNYYPSQQQQNVQQQPMFQQSGYRQAPPQTGLKGRLVSSPEEARAASIDFDGSIFYFPDLANKRIYTKQINIDGTATINIYELKEIPLPKESSYEYPSLDKFVTREEFERVLAEFRQRPTEPVVPAQPQKVEVMSF